MDFGVHGKTALVLAGGGGLGRASAMALAREGVNVALADIEQHAVEQGAALVEAAGVRASALTWNFSDHASIDGDLGRVESEFGPIDILVNITGGPPPTPAAGQTPKVWNANFQSMIMPVIAITDRVLPSMRERKWGRVITSTSSGVVAPIPNLGISNALRLSLVGWSKTLSREVARDGVTGNVVVPGRIATQRIAFLDEARAKREGRTAESVVAER